MICAMWAGHTVRSQALCDRFRSVLRAKYRKEEAAAIDMRGLTPSQLSRAFAGAEGLSLWRVAELPDDVRWAFHQNEIEALGGRVLSPADLDLVLAFSVMPRAQMFQMLKMTMPEASERKQA